MTKKKKRKKKDLNKPKLPPNEAFWLATSKNTEDIKEFVEVGNDRQRQYIKAVIDYRLWQIQEGQIRKDFFGDLDVKKLDYNIKVVKRKKRKSVKKTKEKAKPIDLFDMSNINDLTKDKK